MTRRIVAMRASRGASTSSSVGVASRVSPSFAVAAGAMPPAGKPNGWYDASSSSTGIAEPGVAGEQQVPLSLDQGPLTVDLLVQLGLGQQPGAVERRIPQRLEGNPSCPVVVVGGGVTRQRPSGMLPVELGLDVGGHVDVVDDETLEVATEVDVAAIAVDDLQTADLAIADLEASKVAQLDAGTLELVTLGVLSSHRSNLPHPCRRRRAGPPAG